MLLFLLAIMLALNMLWTDIRFSNTPTPERQKVNKNGGIEMSNLDSLRQVLRKTDIINRTQLWKLIKALGISEKGEGAEIGTWTGDTAYSILDNWGGTLYMIDPYTHLDIGSYKRFTNKEQTEMDEKFSETQKRMKRFGERAIFVRKLAKHAHRDFSDMFFDWIFIDGDHTLRGIFADVWYYWDKVRPGGLFCGHDYRHTPGTDEIETIAVKDIVDALSYTIDVPIYTKSDGVWCTIKP